MKRLLLITLIAVTCVLAGVLHGGYLQEEREGHAAAAGAYAGLFPEVLPDMVFDATVFPAPLL